MCARALPPGRASIHPRRGRQDYRAPDASCCSSDQAGLAASLYAEWEDSIYSSTAAEIEGVIDCHCAGMYPLRGGEHIDLLFHLYHTTASYDEYSAGCQDTTCNNHLFAQQGVNTQGLCLVIEYGMGGKGCSDMARTAERSQTCHCAVAADQGDKLDPFYTFSQ